MQMFKSIEKLFLISFLLSPIFFPKCETINKAHNEFANSKEIDAKQVDSLSNSFMNFGKSYFVPYTTSNSRLHLSPVKQQIDQSMVRLLT